MGKQWKVSDFIFLGSKITADGDCSHGIKRCLLLGRKVMTNLDSILKSSGLPGAPQDEAGLTRKFETRHVGTCQERLHFDPGGFVPAQDNHLELLC